MDKIAIIIPYFGKLPSFYKLWEVTAEANSTVDFYIFTDSDEICSHQNIHVVSISFSEFKEILQKQFDFPIACRTPYKLCDYKPVYGNAFHEMLQPYDWWGYCDLDLLLGDIRKFFSATILSQYDRCQYLGHLSIYRNCSRMNDLYKVQEGGYPALNYETVYQSEESFYFDEARGMYTKGLLEKISVFRETSFRDPMETQRKFYDKSVSADNQFVVLWENGKCWSVRPDGDRTELLYAHFFRRTFEIPSNLEAIERIKIVPRRAIVNAKIEAADFHYAEGYFYKYAYLTRNLLRSIRRYGLIRTVMRQNWSRHHNRYVRDLEKITERT